MKSLRLLSALAVLSLGSLAFASDKKAEDCKDCTACKDAAACCKEKAEKSACCKDKAAKKDSEKKPDQK